MTTEEAGQSSTKNDRDCEHGQLARSCEICELLAECGKLEKLGIAMASGILAVKMRGDRSSSRSPAQIVALRLKEKTDGD